VRYFIVAGDPEAQFSIDEELGVIRVAKSLDRETQSRYELTVQAVDQADDPHDRLSSSVVVSDHLSIIIIEGFTSSKVDLIKSFPNHKAHRAVLISVALSQTPAYTARPRIGRY